VQQLRPIIEAYLAQTSFADASLFISIDTDKKQEQILFKDIPIINLMEELLIPHQN
jgi:Rad3-related DNA helicase